MNNNAAMEVFKYSKELGNEGPLRQQSYVHSKMSEELGEHSVELQIKQGTSYKKPGKDLIHGEAVDLAICCLDSFALEFPELSAEEIYKKFNEYMLVKLEKWKNTNNKTDKVNSSDIKQDNISTKKSVPLLSKNLCIKLATISFCIIVMVTMVVLHNQ